MRKVSSKGGRTACLIFSVTWCALVPQPAMADQINNRHGVSLAILERVKTEANGQSYDVQPAYNASFRQRLTKSGINLVRLVTRPSPMLVGSKLSRDKAVTQVVQTVHQLVAENMTVIVDPHFWPPDTNQDNVAVSCGEGKDRYREMLLRLAQALNAVRHDRVMLELLNEPNPCKVDGEPGWLSTQIGFVRAIRNSFKTLPLFVTGTQGGPGPLWINPAPYITDKNIYFNWHYYGPFIFTHQDTYYGFEGVPWPGPGELEAGKLFYSKVNKTAAKASDLGDLRHYLSAYKGVDAIAGEFAAVSDWARKHKIEARRIVVGEFGVNWKPANKINFNLRNDELRWIRAVQGQAKVNSFSSAFWIFPLGGDNYNFDQSETFLRSDVLEALGFASPAVAPASK